MHDCFRGLGAATGTDQRGVQGTVSDDNGSAHVSATGDTPFTYQWYVGPSGDDSAPVSGATSASFTTPALTDTTTYWVRVSNGCLTPADSSSVTITVSGSIALIQSAFAEIDQSNASPTVTLAATPSEGSLLVAFVSASYAWAIPTITSPEGFVSAVNRGRSWGTYNKVKGEIFYKIAGASESTSYQFATDGSSAGVYLAEYAGAALTAVLDQT
ncbi:MAG TPA: hypothetical protein VM534_00175, partial [Thermoanaerobaculia bacterium]|nr:hypothetical protein [Thermoanaerobaculia bacterium]